MEDQRDLFDNAAADTAVAELEVAAGAPMQDEAPMKNEAPVTDATPMPPRAPLGGGGGGGTAAALRPDDRRVWRQCCRWANTHRLQYLQYAIATVKDRALPRVGDGQKPVQGRILYSMWDKQHTRRHQANEVRGRRRRRARQVASARRPIGVRRAGAARAEFHHALSADRRRGQFRFARRRRSGRLSIHGSAADEVRRGTAGGTRPGHGRFHSEL